METSVSDSHGFPSPLPPLLLFDVAEPAFPCCLASLSRYKLQCTRLPKSSYAQVGGSHARKPDTHVSVLNVPAAKEERSCSGMLPRPTPARERNQEQCCPRLECRSHHSMLEGYCFVLFSFLHPLPRNQTLLGSFSFHHPTALTSLRRSEGCRQSRGQN